MKELDEPDLDLIKQEKQVGCSAMTAYILSGVDEGATDAGVFAAALLQEQQRRV